MKNTFQPSMIKAEILHKQGEESAAIKSWEEAIKVCNNDKFITEIKEKMKRIQ